MSFRSGQIIIISIEITHQFVNSLGGWVGIDHNVGIFYLNLTVFWLFSWRDQVTVSITTIFQHTVCFNLSIIDILYINRIHSCVIIYNITWQCCIHLIRNTEFCLLLAHINWKYSSCHNIISRKTFCGFQNRCQIVDIYVQCFGDTVDILSVRANIGYSVNLLHIYCKIISRFDRRNIIAVNGVSSCFLTINSHLYFT